jgi:hypothetical protein
MSLRLPAALAAVLLAGPLAPAADQGRLDPHYPFRTDWANQELPWYRLQPGVFPPYHSDHRVGGTLVAEDFVRRAGRFRIDRTGELVDFTMPPYGTIAFRNAEAELRDVPLGTFFLFFLHQDEQGAFTRLATMQDEYSMLANHGFTWRITALKLDEGRLAVVKQKLGEDKLDEGHGELLVDEATRVWKSDASGRAEQPLKLVDLAVGDALLVELGAATPQGPRRCTDIWVGVGTHAAVSERQRKAHAAYLKERGLPGWIDAIDGRKLTVSLFGDRGTLLALLNDEGLDPARLGTDHRHVEVAVADEQLRTYNPPVDKRGSNIVAVQTVPVDAYGCSGERWTIEPDLLLEGFRAGRVVRIFDHKWPVKDMPFGEGAYEHGVEVDDLDPRQFRYRTDLANADLPWYRLAPGVFPPAHSTHELWADLVQVDALRRTARLRDERGQQLDVALPPFAAVRYRGAEAELDEIPPGTRCLVGLTQDERGAFTWASTIADDFTCFADQGFSYRLDTVQPAGAVPAEQPAAQQQGAAQPPILAHLLVGKRMEPINDYRGEAVRPPDLGRCLLAVDARTRIWKGDRAIALAELAVGDELLADLGGRSPTSEGRCTELWVGADTRKQTSEQQRARHRALAKARGMPAYVVGVEGRKVTVVFFAAVRADFPALLDGDPWGKSVMALPVDERLQPAGPPERVGFSTHLPEGDTAGCAGSSGVRWVLEVPEPGRYRVGQAIRVFKDGWPLPPDAIPVK